MRIVIIITQRGVNVTNFGVDFGENILKSNLLLALATRSRGYTDKTHLRGFQAFDF
ncbi:MAG: hypothetical protein ACKO3K_18225 [Cuspidothrix sp.]